MINNDHITNHDDNTNSYDNDNDIIIIIVIDVNNKNHNHDNSDNDDNNSNNDKTNNNNNNDNNDNDNNNRRPDPGQRRWRPDMGHRQGVLPYNYTILYTIIYIYIEREREFYILYKVLLYILYSEINNHGLA